MAVGVSETASNTIIVFPMLGQRDGMTKEVFNKGDWFHGSA